MCVVWLAALGCAPQQRSVPEVGVRQQALTSAYSSVVLMDRPASYWRFNETSGTKIADQQGARTGVYAAATLGQSGALANDSDAAFAVAASTGGNASEVATIPGTSFQMTGLACGTTYALGVRAVDTSGNLASLVTVGGTTLACPVAADEPAPPVNPTTIYVTGSHYTVSANLSDVVFEVTGGTSSGNAVVVNPGVTLTRAVVNTHRLVTNGINGGIVKDCLVTEAAYSGFASNTEYQGTNKSGRSNVGFYLSGSGVKCTPGAMLRAENSGNFGLITEHLFDTNLDCRLRADNSGNYSGNDTATGFEVWADTARLRVAEIRANGNRGYAAAIAKASGDPSDDIVIDSLVGSNSADPGLTVTGGVRFATVRNIDLSDNTFGITVGEDNPNQNYWVTLESVRVTGAQWGCLRTEHAQSLRVNGLTCIDTGSRDPSLGVASVDVRSGFGAYVQDFILTGLDQSGSLGGSFVPRYAVHVDAGATGSITGACRSWSIAKVSNENPGGFHVGC